MPAAVTEKDVLAIWQDLLRDRRDLETAAAEPVTIVYPGRRNDDRGADFKDAVIATRGGRLKGDIEIHVNSSDWRTHRHDEDPAYNRVILHVAYRNDGGDAVVLENGSTAPTVALINYLRNNSAPIIHPSTSCRGVGYRGNALWLARRLDEAGLARFFAQAARLKEMTGREGAGQALYRGIMAALGYSKNKAAMAELAGFMPLEQLEAAAPDNISDNEYLARCQALLMGAAGLLPSQQAGQYGAGAVEEWVESLEHAWAVNGKPASMSAGDWRFFKVRPGNHPVRRIAAMSCLLTRCRGKCLLAGLEGIFSEARADKVGGELEQALLVPPDGYWGRYLDFGLPAVGIVPALLGRDRAADIIVNVLLPFYFSRNHGQEAGKALHIFGVYRAPAENGLVKHMRLQFGITRYLTDTARRQQGLIHIYKTQCAEGRCEDCPMV